MGICTVPAFLDGIVGIQHGKAPETFGKAAGIYCSMSSPLLKRARKLLAVLWSRLSAVTPGIYPLSCCCCSVASVVSDSATPTVGSPPGSPVPGILQARPLEWVAISFSNARKWKVKVKSLSRVRLLPTPWTAASQAPSSMGFSRQEFRSGVPLPSPTPLASVSQNALLGLPASNSLRELVNSTNFWPLLQTPKSLGVKLGCSTFNKLAKFENHCPKWGHFSACSPKLMSLTPSALDSDS